MEELELVTYCGLYCDLCGQRCRIPARASALRDSLAKEGYDSWARDIAGFGEFWAFLQGICEPSTACPGCRDGGGPPHCGIRTCAVENGVRLCPECPRYPCHRVRTLAEAYPTLMADGARIRKMGLQAWVKEQEERASNGFCYADIRCEPYEIPES